MSSALQICKSARRYPAVVLLLISGCSEGEQTPPANGISDQVTASLSTLSDISSLEPGVARAVEHAHGAVREAPGDANAWFELGMVLDANSMYEAAREAYAQTAELDPGHARALYHGARMLRMLGSLQPSRAALDRVLALDPTYAPAHRLSAEWHLQSGEFEAAEAGFVRVSELEPEWPDGALGLAHLALLMERPGEALDLMNAVLASHSNSHYAQHLLGTALRDLRRVDEAAAAFALAGDGVPNWRDPWADEVRDRHSGFGRLMAEAKICLQQGLYEEACERLERLHRQAPEDVHVQEFWTAALLELSRSSEALEMLSAARERQPAHYSIELNLALVRRSRGELDLASEHLRRSIELNPRHRATHMVQARVLYEKKDIPGSLGAYENALRLGGDPKRLLPRIGKLQVALRRWDEAAKTYGQAAEAVPGSAALHATHASCLVEAGDHEGARAAIGRVRAIDPGYKLLPKIEARMAALSAGEKP